MGWTRRQMLELGAKLGLAGAMPWAPGCVSGDDDDSAIEPSGWPPFEGCDPETVDTSYSGAPGPDGLFVHGVASGDPLADAVMLWTRVSPLEDGPADGFWELSETDDFDPVLASGPFSTGPARDYTVKVEATCLRPGRTYFYRFLFQGRTSPVGRTRTAPYGPNAHQRLAVCSCSSMQHGYFHGYRAIAERDNLDLVLHLGDYIYEYGDGEYGSVRTSLPPTETITLADYRLRHATYKRDPDLQAAHGAHPWVCTWDDHEVANNAWSGGAGNHNAGEGDWATRKAAGEQAYYEYLPIREGDEGVIYRRLLRGDLIDILVLDTRLEARPEEASTNDEAYAEGRQLLGATQESWLLDRLSSSPSRWKLVAQQVVMAQWSLSTDDEGRPRPLNKDAWDGFQSARRRILERIVEDDLDGVVVLTGDVHSSWANDLAVDFTAYDGDTQAGAVAVEAVCPGITSPGAGDLADALIALNPHIRWGDSNRRGFIVLDATHEALQCDWFLYDAGSVESSTYLPPTLRASFVVRPGRPYWEVADGPIED